jgi:hypothetical protein
MPSFALEQVSNDVTAAPLAAKRLRLDPPSKPPRPRLDAAERRCICWRFARSLRMRAPANRENGRQRPARQAIGVRAEIALAARRSAAL